MPKYRYVGTEADSLASGRPLAPGEFVTLKGDEDKDAYNARLIEEGKLIEAKGGDQSSGKEGDSK